LPALDFQQRRRVHVLDVDPDLADAVPAEDQATARRFLVADAQELPRGPWTPALTCRDGRDAFTLVILDGLVLREVVLADRRAAQVFGPGDVVRPAVDLGSSLAEGVEWTVMETATVMLLDGAFVSAARRWPGLQAIIADRLFAQVDRAAVQLAIAQLPRIEQRVLAVLWHLADRFGHVTAAGVVVPLVLTHETLGRLVGARRPTVSLGLTALHESGSIHRRSDGRWLLDAGSRPEMTERSLLGMEPPALRLVAGRGA
jgi:CRP-like cAMP-binding protein